ncbi:MAG: PHP domain-containing protein [Parcubacteria group bacterium]
MFDLHFHSTYSDGKQTVPELAAIIREKKLSHCSLTDHNSVDGIRELEDCLIGSGTNVIHGTELTAKYRDNEVHILAYDFVIDQAAKILKERNDLVRKLKQKEMALAVQLSQEEGQEVTDGLQPAEKQPVGLTIALDICTKRFNQDLFLRRHGKELTPEEFYFFYQAPGKSCAVERSGVTIEWLVEKFNGVARDLIIAHPFVSVSIVTTPLDEPQIHDVLNLGLTGIEVYHPDTNPAQIEILKRLVHERSLHFTGGSDSHGKERNAPLGYYNHDTTIPDFRLTNDHGEAAS